MPSTANIVGGGSKLVVVCCVPLLADVLSGQSDGLCVQLQMRRVS